MKINIIVSASLNWVIGANNKLIWKLRSDLKRFKELTTGKVIIMGQKTFESLPNGPLPNRTNIILTDDSDYSVIDAILAFDVQDALIKAKYYGGEDGEVFIIGGGSIYRQFLPLADTIYLTRVHTMVEGDTTFPNIDEMNAWESTLTEEINPIDEKNEFEYSYQIYQKIKTPA